MYGDDRGESERELFNQLRHWGCSGAQCPYRVAFAGDVDYSNALIGVIP